MQAERKILIVRLSSLGDVLMTIPAVFSIKNTFPDSNISWLVEGSVSDFLSHQREINRVIKFPRGELVLSLRRGRIGDTLRIIIDFLKNLRSIEYDLILDFHGIIKSVILSRLSRRKKIIGFGKKYAKEGSNLFYDVAIEGEDKRLHKIERNMLLTRYLGVISDIPEIELIVPQVYHEYIENFLSAQGIPGDIFAVNPFSSPGSGYKRWDLDKYSRLINLIGEELKVKSLILWGPGELKEAQNLKAKSGENAFLACPTNISQLFALLQKTKLYISGDTGVMHLAAFAKTPVVGIFGPTDHRINSPYGPHCMIIRKEMPCSPCKNKECPERKCLEDISVDEVFNAVKEIYKGYH